MATHYEDDERGFEMDVITNDLQHLSMRPRKPHHHNTRQEYEVYTQRASSSLGSSPDSSADVYSSQEYWSMAEDFLNSGSRSHGGLDTIQETKHTRAMSQRNPPKEQATQHYMYGDDWDIGESRPRVSSMPLRADGRSPDQSYNEKGSRRYWISTKGTLTHDDTSQGADIKDLPSSHDLDTNRSITKSNQSRSDLEKQEHHKVLFLGSSGVGKRALIKLFASENQDGDENGSFGEWNMNNLSQCPIILNVVKN